MATKRGYLVLVIVGFLAVGFWGGFTNVHAADTNQLVIAQGSSIETLDPHASNTDTTVGPLLNIFDGLTSRTAEGEIQPALATAYERLDPVTWRFILREGVHFHNGDLFTADDVKFSLERIRDFEMSRWQTTGKMIKEVRIVSDFVVEVVTVDPFPILLANLHQIAMLDKETLIADPNSVAEFPNGTGAYKFVEWVPGDHLSLVANEEYWDGAPSITHVIFRPIVEPFTRLAALESDEVDIITDVPIEATGRVKGNPRLELVVRPGRRIIFFGMDQRPGAPTSDLRVRQAIYMAINEQEIIEKVMGGYAAPATQLVDPACTGFNPSIERPAYNPERAKELLAEAGYPDGFKLNVDVPFDRYVMDEQIGVAIAVYLSRIGIQVDLRTRPKSIHFGNILNGNTEFYMLGWSEGTFDTYRELTMLVRTPNPEKGYGAWNAGAHSNSRLDELLDQSATVLDIQERAALLQEANKVAMEDVAAIPLHYQADVYGVDSSFDFTPRIDKWIIAKDITVK